MRFRGTRSDAERRRIELEYAQTVDRLIHSGAWQEAPAPEDQLPDDRMPQEYFKYWSHPPGSP